MPIVSISFNLPPVFLIEIATNRNDRLRHNHVKCEMHFAFFSLFVYGFKPCVFFAHKKRKEKSRGNFVLSKFPFERNFNWFVNRKTVISSWWWKYELPSHTAHLLACIENILIKNCGEWRGEDRGKMKSSAMNVQVDVTFYKKTFNSRFSLAEWVSDAVAAKASSLQKAMRTEMCSNVTLLLTILLSSSTQLSVCVSNRLTSSSCSCSRLCWLVKKSLYGTHKCCHQFFFRDALHVIIYHF